MKTKNFIRLKTNPMKIWYQVYEGLFGVNNHGRLSN